MEQSQSIVKLVGALIKAQSDIRVVEKGAENPFFHSKYADLPAIFKEYQRVFLKHGLVVVQLVEGKGLRTTLAHESGEFVSGVADMILQKNDPQGLGSAITYQRRYSLATICGIVASEDDDDGNASTHTSTAEEKNHEPTQPKGPRETIGIVSEKSKPNAGGYITYIIDGVKVSTKDPDMITTLDNRMRDKVKLCVRYAPASNPKWPGSILELMVVNEEVPF